MSTNDGGGGLPPPPDPPPGWGPGQGWQPAPGAQPGWPQPPPPHAAGPVPIRPLDLGDVLDGTFRLLRADWAALLLLTAAFYAPLTLLTTWLQRDLLRGPGLLDSVVGQDLTLQLSDLDQLVLGSLAVTLLTFVVVEPIVEGAIAHIAATSYLGGRARWQAAAGLALRRSWALIAARLLVTLAVIAAFVPATALIVGAVAGGSALLGVLGGVLVLLGMLAGMLLWSLFVAAPAAIVVEGVGPLAGLRRSARLLRPRLWPVLGIMLLATLVATLVSSVIGFPFSFVGQLFGGVALLVLSAVASILQGMLSRPLTVIPQVLLYFDGRVRREGLDFELGRRG